VSLIAIVVLAPLNAGSEKFPDFKQKDNKICSRNKEGIRTRTTGKKDN
jgi:hypothetical protein